MKLLLDNNLSYKLVGKLADLFPLVEHVAHVGLDCESDEGVWQYANDHGFAIVTKDSDFRDLSVLNGFPPKVIWLQIGNCTTSRIEESLRTREAAIKDFLSDAVSAVLALR